VKNATAEGLHNHVRDEIHIRSAAEADVSAMSECRVRDAGAVDERMGAYFRGEHHPYEALMPRAGFVAEFRGSVVGYVAGHLTTRNGCNGELQYLFVSTTFRREHIGTNLVRELAEWFSDRGAKQVCVGVDSESPAAQPFYRALGARPLSADKPHWYVWEDMGVMATRM
jgi:ribosomal protein S18 acetylase RimI-like enzyme